MKKQSTLFTLLIAALTATAQIHNVPGDFQTIAEAVSTAGEGDTILIAPGFYKENLLVTKPLFFASEYINSSNWVDVEQTVIDGQAQAVFTFAAGIEEASTLYGLTIQNGDDGIMASSPVNLFYNYVRVCKDGIDYETGGGGILKHNVFRDNLDDAIDLDGTLHHVVIEHNILADNDDDGIEIRLHDYEGAYSYCRIANNEIYGNGEDGIQFIDYPGVTNREYFLERNLIYNNAMAGIGCMDNGDTKEDYRGAAIPEFIGVYNNTISGHEYGITGSANMLVLNNMILNSTVLAMKNCTGNSVINHNLFFGNLQDTENSSPEAATTWQEDPGLSDEFYLTEGSVAIDKGLSIYMADSDTLFYIPAENYTGSAPDLGAVEYDPSLSNIMQQIPGQLTIFPNPVKESFYIFFPGERNMEPLTVINATGRVMERIPAVGKKIYVDSRHYPQGLYYLLSGRNANCFIKI